MKWRWSAPRFGGFAALMLALAPLPARAQEIIGGIGTYGACASGGCMTAGCQRFHCPPPLHHCVERPPCIKFHHGCPRPTCNPCQMPTWGYFQTCWTPWPWPPDWSHCPVTPPAAYVRPGASAAPVGPGAELPNGKLPPAGSYAPSPIPSPR